MEMKVLLTCKWHYGIPDGENEVSILVDDFDIEEEEEARFVIQNTLIHYGVNSNTLRFVEKDYKNDYVFHGEIGRFDRIVSEFHRLFTQECDIEISMQYVQKHRNQIYKLEEMAYNVEFIEA